MELYTEELLYKDKLYRTVGSNQGEAIKQMIVELRDSENLSYREIGELVNKSYEWVRIVLRDEELHGFRNFPELDNPELFMSLDDEAISAMLSIEIAIVTKARKRLGVKKRGSVSIDARQEWLCCKLFNNKPGPNFSIFLEEMLEQLPEEQERVIREFYIEGKEESPAEDVNSDTDRVYRVKGKARLEEIAKEQDFEQLIERGILEDECSVKSS